MMNKAGIGMVLAIILMAGTGPAQENPPGGPFGGARGGGARGGGEGRRGQMGQQRMGGGQWRGGDSNEMLAQLLQDPRVAQEIGLAEDKSKALQESLRTIREREIDMQAELAKLRLQQAGQVVSLLEDRAKAPGDALEIVEKIGLLNTGIAKLAVERIVAVRDNLTDDQIAKAREIARERIERRREMMNRERRPRDGREGGAGREGRQGREGEARD